MMKEDGAIEALPRENRRRKSRQTDSNMFPGGIRQGRWTCLEHFKFLEALKLFGKEW